MGRRRIRWISNCKSIVFVRCNGCCGLRKIDIAFRAIVLWNLTIIGRLVAGQLA